MSNMDTELKKRVATGVIGGAGLLVLIIWGSWPGIFVLTMVLSLGMLNEYALMSYSMNDHVEKRYALLCLGWFIGLASLLMPRAEIETLLISFMGLFGYY